MCRRRRSQGEFSCGEACRAWTSLIEHLCGAMHRVSTQSRVCDLNTCMMCMELSSAGILVKQLLKAGKLQIVSACLRKKPRICALCCMDPSGFRIALINCGGTRPLAPGLLLSTQSHATSNLLLLAQLRRKYSSSHARTLSHYMVYPD